MRKSFKYIVTLITGLVFFAGQPAFAAGPPAPSSFNNPLAVTLVVLMVLLLIIIGVLGNILIGTADFKLKKRKNANAVQHGASVVMILLCMLLSPVLFAQGGTTTTAPAAANTIGGMTTSTFYVMATILFLELFVILALLINIKFLLKNEKDKLAPAAATPAVKKPAFNWWERFNKLRPVEQEADIDLGHDYDGIRELDNKLPPWWLYGFYLCIIFAGVYLWRYHVSHTAPLSGEEYAQSVALGEERVAAYLKEKGDNVDENTVVESKDPADLAAGKAIFTNPANCPTCHGADGSGIVNGNPGVGANLTDEYYIYGGGIKDLYKTIKYGTTRGMKSWKDDLTAKQIAQVADYVRTLRGTHPPKGKDHEADAKLFVDDTPKAAKDSTAKIDSIIK